MTVTNTTRKASYNGDGSSTVFAVPFGFFEIAVYIDDALVTDGVDYVITQVDPGDSGSVTMTTAPDAGTANVVIIGDTDLAQGIDYTENGEFPAESHENGLDRLTMIVRELLDRDSQAVRAPFSEPALTELSFKNNPNSLLFTDSDGNPQLSSASDVLDGQIDAAAASATAAAASAAAAATAETNSETAETNAAASEASVAANATAATAAQTAAETAETNAVAAQTASETAKTGAETAETNAGASATASAASATAAAASSASSSTAQTAAETAQTAAETAKTGAETAETNAAASLSSFNGVWCGVQASDPTNDANGDPVSEGDFYWNSATKALKFHNGTTFVAYSASSGGDASGPASSTDDALAQFDGTTGKLLKDGPSIGTGNNNIVQLNGSAELPAVSGANLTDIHPTLIVADEKAAGVDGGALTASTWVVRPLPVTDKNDIVGASVTSNQITLPSGDYEVEGFATGHVVAQHKCRLRTTGGVTLAVGSACYAQVSYNANNTSVIKGEFTLGASTVIELQHYCLNTRTNGMGLNVGASEVERYAVLKFTKIG